MNAGTMLSEGLLVPLMRLFEETTFWFGWYSLGSVGFFLKAIVLFSEDTLN